MQAFFNLSSKIITMHPNFAQKLGLQIQRINIGAQKIDFSKLDIFSIAITTFSTKYKDTKSLFFKETFLLANFSMVTILKMSIFTLSNIWINFRDQVLSWKLYTLTKAFPTIRYEKLIKKKKFVAIAFDPKNKAFVVYITFIS